MPQWLGSAIVLAIVAALIGLSIFSRIRTAKRGGGCGCGCRSCTFSCPSRQGDGEDKDPT